MRSTPQASLAAPALIAVYQRAQLTGHAAPVDAFSSTIARSLFAVAKTTKHWPCAALAVAYT